MTAIKNIRAKNLKSVFSFTHTNKIKINGMNVYKTCQLKYIPTKIIKMNAHIFTNFICLHFNYCIKIGEFPQGVKIADIIPVHKKKEKIDKTNCRPFSILPNLSKIYKKLIYNQLHGYFDKILLPSQCGFRKGYSSQHCLLVILENFQESVDDRNEFGALSSDLSKAFDCIDHKLLTSITQRIKINNSFSRRRNIEYGVQS